MIWYSNMQWNQTRLYNAQPKSCNRNHVPFIIDNAPIVNILRKDIGCPVVALCHNQ